MTYERDNEMDRDTDTSGTEPPYVVGGSGHCPAAGESPPIELEKLAAPVRAAIDALTHVEKLLDDSSYTDERGDAWFRSIQARHSLKFWLRRKGLA